MKTRACLCLFLVAASAPVSAGTPRALDMIHYEVPDGWSVDDTTGTGHTLTSSDPALANRAIILISSDPAPPGQVNLGDALSATLKVVLAGHTVVQKTAQVQGETGDGYRFVSQNVAARDSEGRSKFVSLTLSRVGRNFATFGLIASNSASFDRYIPLYKTLLTQVRFLDPLATPKGALAPQVGPRQAVPARTGAGNPAANPAAVFRPPAEILKDEAARRRRLTVSGNVYGTDGQPLRIKGAQVEVNVWGITGKEDLIGVTPGSAGGERTDYRIPVNANGHYELKISGGAFRISATAFIPFGGERVPVDLDPLDGVPSIDYDLNSFRGIVKDFGLKLTGPRAGGAAASGFNGVQIQVNDVSNIMSRMKTRYPKGTQAVIHLTPTSPLLDGSQGWDMDCALDVEIIWEGSNYGGIPYARYRASGWLQVPDGRRIPLRLGVYGVHQTLQREVEVTFPIKKDAFVGPSVEVPSISVNDEPE